ncbi:MAG: PDZ domain-containing protein, partial [Caldilineaceae bacterium]|nr:PDZ domain-containing protein [Caldilineaceae bacterium]
FPCAAGEDGVLFTADDAIAPLPTGYTIARIDGTQVTFDRSRVATVDMVEVPGSETPDFSDQGIVESFGSLIDFLRERYVFNNFYEFDWDAYYEKYLPKVEEAEAADNLALYFLALFDLAQELGDKHVFVTADPAGITSPEAIATYGQGLSFGGGRIGAQTVELDDGRIIVASVTPDSPAAEAELTFGTEIVSVNGAPVQEALENVRSLYFPGSDAALHYRQVQYLLSAVPGTEMEVGYILPGATEVTTTTFPVVPGVPPLDEPGFMPMEYDVVGNFGYVHWSFFRRTGIATHIFADFIKTMNQYYVSGIIIDLRGNGGGADLMEDAVLSYLYSAEEPYTHDGTTKFHYNTGTGEWVSEFESTQLSAPAGVAPFLGAVVVLVDTDCASACEFLSYGLQRTGRATVVAQYASNGAGGSTNAIVLP